MKGSKQPMLSSSFKAAIMDKDRITGGGKQAAGRVKQTAGKASRDPGSQVRDGAE